MECHIRTSKQVFGRVPLVLRGIGYRYEQMPIRRPKGLGMWQLIFGAEGLGECLLEGKKSRLGRGRVLLLPPDMPHSYESAGEEPWLVHFLLFSGNACNKLMVDMRFYRGGVYHLNHEERFAEEIEGFLPVIEAPSRDRDWILSKKLYSLLLDLSLECSYMETSGEIGKNSLSSGILLYLEEHSAEDLSLQDLAGEFGRTPEYLCACFKKETGETILQHLTRIRVGRARTMLLENPELPAYEVGARCGFHSPSYFGKVFRKHTGVTPQEYVKRS